MSTLFFIERGTRVELIDRVVVEGLVFTKEVMLNFSILLIRLTSLTLLGIGKYILVVGVYIFQQ